MSRPSFSLNLQGCEWLMDVIQQPRDDVYGPYDASYLHSSGPKQATQSPVVTGTSVIAIKFKDGVVMAADNLGMFGLGHTNYFTSAFVGQFTIKLLY
jgi:hypothetical protein